MARARNIKPSFFKNETLVDLPFEHRLLFVGLWTLADKEGRLEDRPKRIKMELFPADNVDVEQGLALLERHGFIKRYSAGGFDAVQVIAFAKHQSPHHTEKASELPDVNGEITVKPRKQDGGNPPDSLIPDSLIPDSLIPDSLIPDSLIPDSLIPDSLIPESDGSGEPDAGKPARAKSGKTALDYSAWPEQPTPQVLADWISMRAKAKAPVSQTVINQFSKELAAAAVDGRTVDDCLAECVTRGWRGFKAEWLRNSDARAGPAKGGGTRHNEFENRDYNAGVSNGTF